MDIKGGFSKQLTKINLKTSAFMEENKIDSYIASLQKEIGELKKRMGEMTYTLLKEDRLEASAFSSIMAEIDEREQRIVKLRYFQMKTQMEVSREIGISQAQVSRLEKGALERLKKYI